MDAEVISRMAKLARLDEADGRDLAPDLLRILEFVERLRGIDVEGVEPFAGAPDGITRPDRRREEA